MWDSLSPPWQACLEEAWAAYCAGSIPIGAVVTNADGQILSRGRNRICEAAGEYGHLYGQTLAHAEINALITLQASQLERHTCVLYTTTEPCPLCLGAFYMSSVRTLHYACREPFAGSLNLLGKTPYLSRKPIRIYGPGGENLENAIMALAVEFELANRDRPPQELLDAWRGTAPRGVALGEQLYHSGELRRRRFMGIGPAEVFDWLDGKV